MSIADQNIGKLHQYERHLDQELEQIYNFLQFAKYPRASIDGESLRLGSVVQNRLRPPISADRLILDDDGGLEIAGPVALGGGAPATLGTIGGDGPTLAVQAEWLEIEVNGASRWIATWE